MVRVVDTTKIPSLIQFSSEVCDSETEADWPDVTRIGGTAGVGVSLLGHSKRTEGNLAGKDGGLSGSHLIHGGDVALLAARVVDAFVPELIRPEEVGIHYDSKLSVSS